MGFKSWTEASCSWKNGKLYCFHVDVRHWTSAMMTHYTALQLQTSCPSINYIVLSLTRHIHMYSVNPHYLCDAFTRKHLSEWIPRQSELLNKGQARENSIEDLYNDFKISSRWKQIGFQIILAWHHVLTESYVTFWQAW